MERINHLKSSIVNNQETYFLFITLFGYILSDINPFELKKLSVAANLLLRGFVFILSVYFIIKNFEIIKKRKSVIISFLLFFSFYIMKVYYTLQNFPFNDNVLPALRNVLYYFVLIIVPLPVVAILSLDYKKIDFKRFYKTVFSFLFVILSVNFLFIGKENGNRNGIFNAYYIITGYYGLSLVVMSLFSYLFLKEKSKIYLIGLLLGFTPMFVSAARSPVLAFFLIVFLFILLKNNRKYWIYSGIAVVLFAVSFFIIYKSGIGDNIVFFKRINAAIFENNASGRSYYLNKGIDVFTNNPWFGGRVLFEDGMYSHNLFVDILMSTGLLGIILFIIYFKFVVKIFIKVLKNIYKYKESGILVFFFLQYLVLVQTSGCTYASFEFWYFGAAIIGLGYINLTNEEIKSNDSRGYATGDH